MLLSQYDFSPAPSISFSPVKNLSPNRTPSRKKPRRYSENKVVPLINEFYDLFYSYRNLSLKDSLFVIGFFISIGLAVVVTFKFQNPHSETTNIGVFLFYLPAVILHASILNRHEKNIVDNYNATNHTAFYSIVEAQKHWLIHNFRADYQPSDLIKKFEEWRKWREAYPPAYKFRWARYIYNADAKARIMGGTTALLALVGVLLFNLYKFSEPEVVIDQLITNFFYLIFVFIFMIIPLFLMGLFSRDLLKTLFYSIFDFLYKNEFSESKYKKFMSFLVTQLEIAHNRSFK